MIEVEISERKPEGFVSSLQIAACYLQIDGKFLFLQRAPEKLAPLLWGVPAGKFELRETPEQAAERELYEETGIHIENPMRSIGLLYVRRSDMEFTYHMFEVPLRHRPEVHLSDEHVQYTWASLEELQDLPLIPGAWAALQYYLNWLTHDD